VKLIILLLCGLLVNEDLFGPEIEEEDSDGDLDRQPISSLLGIPRCMSRVYYLLDTVSKNKFEFNLLLRQIKIIFSFRNYH
jgi:hypothetical protein